MATSCGSVKKTARHISLLEEAEHVCILVLCQVLFLPTAKREQLACSSPTVKSSKVDINAMVSSCRSALIFLISFRSITGFHGMPSARQCCLHCQREVLTTNRGAAHHSTYLGLDLQSAGADEAEQKTEEGENLFKKNTLPWAKVWSKDMTHCRTPVIHSWATWKCNKQQEPMEKR